METRPWALITCTLILFLTFPLLVGAQAVIEDFEGYANTTALNLKWGSGTLDTTTPNDGGGLKSLYFGISSIPDGSSTLTFRGFNPALDLSTQSQVSVWVRRNPASVPSVDFSLILWSGGNGCASSLTCSDSDWHELHLTTGDCPLFGGLDLSAIDKIEIDIYNSSGVSGPVWGNIDDITTDGSVPVGLLSFAVE